MHKMTIVYEMGDDDFSLLEYLYSQLKWEGLSPQKGHSQDYRGGRGT